MNYVMMIPFRMWKSPYKTCKMSGDGLESQPSMVTCWGSAGPGSGPSEWTACAASGLPSRGGPVGFGSVAVEEWETASGWWWLEHGFYFSRNIGKWIIIPIDELIFFRGVGLPPTSHGDDHTKSCFRMAPMVLCSTWPHDWHGVGSAVGRIEGGSSTWQRGKLAESDLWSDVLPMDNSNTHVNHWPYCINQSSYSFSFY